MQAEGRALLRQQYFSRDQLKERYIDAGMAEPVGKHREGNLD
jgi:hypothetical protein